LGRELIKGEKSSDGKSINLVDLTFFPLETVLIQLAIRGLHENIFCIRAIIDIRKFLIVIIRKLGAAVAADLLMRINVCVKKGCAVRRLRLCAVLHLATLVNDQRRKLLNPMTPGYACKSNATGHCVANGVSVYVSPISDTRH
jgi:hypothetical protein